jgi:hypothetical protein
VGNSGYYRMRNEIFREEVRIQNLLKELEEKVIMVWPCKRMFRTGTSKRIL